MSSTDTAQAFGHRLRLMREHMEIDQYDMALKLGHSLHTQRIYDAGLALPNVRRMGEIARILGVPVTWLMGQGQTFSWGG